MAAPRQQSQTALLNRLYQMKQKQLMQASKQNDSLLYRVLEAEAQAISDALNAQRR